jgi:hypothetical protein
VLLLQGLLPEQRVLLLLLVMLLLHVAGLRGTGDPQPGACHSDSLSV